MKKILLFALLSVAILSMQAQTAKKQPVVAKLSKDLLVRKIKADMESTNIYPGKPYNDYTHEKGIQSLNKVPVGSSANIYSVLLEEQNCLSSNKDLNLIAFTHRKSVPLVSPENSGYIQTHFSTDGGLSWDSIIVHADGTNWGRYPSGVIYNPAGNTTVGNAYSVVAGPYTTSAGGWMGSFHASKRFDGTNGNEYINTVDTNVVSGSFLPRSWMQIDNTGKIRLMAEKNLDNGTNYTTFKTTIFTGVFNSGSNAFDWTSIDKVPDYTVGSTSLPDGLRTPAMAFSDDGQTGYLVYVGRNVNAIDPLAYHPMIYKTTDGGTTWDLQPAVDWNSMPVISSYLNTVDSTGLHRAFFGLIKDAIVDANGKLHFVTFINSASSNDPDSLGYSFQFTNIEGYMFHCWENGSGWNADLIDTQWGKDVDATNSPINPGTWSSRLQLSKTPAQDKIIFGWTDTDTSYIQKPYYNLYPDIKTQIFDINTNTSTATTNLTAGGSYDGDNYFMFLSRNSFFNTATNEITLHMTTSKFGTTDVSPAYHYYLTGAQISLGVNDPAKNGISSVSQNYPNPFTGTTQVDITLDKPASVVIDVTNMLGQTISSTSKQLTEGTHTVTLNADNMKSGIYFYTVKTNISSVTHKMIVK